MARYRITARSYINDRLYEEGEEIEFQGDHLDPGHNLEPLDDEAKKRKAEFIKKAGKRLSPNDPGYINALVERNNEPAAA